MPVGCVNPSGARGGSVHPVSDQEHEPPFDAETPLPPGVGRGRRAGAEQIRFRLFSSVVARGVSAGIASMRICRASSGEACFGGRLLSVGE